MAAQVGCASGCYLTSELRVDRGESDVGEGLLDLLF